MKWEPESRSGSFASLEYSLKGCRWYESKDGRGTTPRMEEVERSRKPEPRAKQEPESRALQEQLPRDAVAAPAIHARNSGDFASQTRSPRTGQARRVIIETVTKMILSVVGSRALFRCPQKFTGIDGLRVFQ